MIALAILVARLSECGAGLGLGAGGSTVPEASEAKAVKPEQKADAGVVGVVVVGSQCTIAGAEPIDCKEACRRLEAESDPGRKIEIDAAQGSHGTVEALRECLSAAGLVAELRSE